MSENKNKADTVPSQSKSSIMQWLPLLFSCIAGIVLLVSGFDKSIGIDLFIRQIIDYKIITSPLLVIPLAWGLIIIECCLGTALLTNYKPKISIPISALLIAFFISVTGWAWITGATNDCGCFGSLIKRTPGEAMVEDLFLLGMLIFSFKFGRFSKRWPFHLKEFLLLVAFMTGLILPLSTSTLLDRIDRAIAGPNQEKYEHFKLKDFTKVNLSKGWHIIVVMSTECPHCRASLKYINKLAQDKNLPTLIALTMNTKEQLNDFNDEFNPDFKLYQISEDDFWRILGDGDIPRTILIDNGRIIKKWDSKVPDIKNLEPLL